MRLRVGGVGVGACAAPRTSKEYGQKRRGALKEQKDWEDQRLIIDWRWRESDGVNEDYSAER